MKHNIKGNVDLKHKDPVCGMEVSYKTAPAMIEYAGKTYYFCADICRQEFEEEPEKYLHKFKKSH